MEACVKWAESGELSARGFAKAVPKIAQELRTTRSTEADAEAIAENIARETQCVSPPLPMGMFAWHAVPMLIHLRMVAYLLCGAT